MTVGQRRTTKGPSDATSEHSLRRKAEKICRQQKAIPAQPLETLSLEEIRKAFQELQVHPNPAARARR
jgi:hypothetical protein